MDETTLEATIEAYQQQLQQIETVLQSAGSEGLEDLLQIQRDLKEVIELTQGSLLSLRKSKLLTYVDDLTSSTPPKQENVSEAQKEAGSGIPPDISQMDAEFAAFQAAIADENNPSSISAGKDQQKAQIDGDDDDDDDDEEDDDDDEDNEEELEDISGTKCSVVYQHEWGAQQRHNALVFSIERPSRQEEDEEVKVRVIFCNPTNASMKPCPYFFKGECRFGEDDCRFSHGHIVRASELKPFQEINLSSLSVESKCLAKYGDDIWYPAQVTDIDHKTSCVTVCFESYGDSLTLPSQDVLPASSHTTSDDDDDDDGKDDESDASDHDFPTTSSSSSVSWREGQAVEEGAGEGAGEGPGMVWMPTGPSYRLGEWETHTRGIGSKLMASMGYQIGQGLGKHGEGRVEPVEAVIVPAGKSLDTCMKMREMKKLGIVGKNKKKGQGKKRRRKRKGGGGGVAGGAAKPLRKRKDVFEFINTHLGAKKVKVNELLADNIVLVKSHRVHREENKGERKANTRQLNVQLLKTQEEVRSAEKKIKNWQQSLARNERDKGACATIRDKIRKAEDYIVTLKASQGKLERQKTSRDHHRKLTIF